MKVGLGPHVIRKSDSLDRSYTVGARFRHQKCAAVHVDHLSRDPAGLREQKSTTAFLTVQTGQPGSLSLELCVCCRAMTMTLTVIPQTLPRFYSARVAISKGAVARRR